MVFKPANFTAGGLVRLLTILGHNSVILRLVFFPITNSLAVHPDIEPLSSTSHITNPLVLMVNVLTVNLSPDFFLTGEFYWDASWRFFSHQGSARYLKDAIF